MFIGVPHSPKITVVRAEEPFVELKSVPMRQSHSVRHNSTSCVHTLLVIELLVIAYPHFIVLDFRRTVVHSHRCRRNVAQRRGWQSKWTS